MSRTPDEILTVLDQAQEIIIQATGYGQGELIIDLRALIWEILADVLDSLQSYDHWEFKSSHPAQIIDEAHDMLTDYLVNHYGDD